MKCILCNQRKGKRHCPAKSALICAQCCGEKRVLEIDCPESCQYLQAGRSYEAKQESTRHLHSRDPKVEQARARVLDHFEPQVVRLEYLVAEERRSARDLKDRDVADAFDLLLQTYRTEENGILYERVSDHHQVESLRRRLREAVEELRRPKDAAQSVLRLSEAIACLEFVRGLVQSHIEARESPSSYVDFLARMLPRAGVIEQPGPSLIVPGR